MACNTEYSTGGNATSVTVNNYYGDSIAASAGESVAWNAVGDSAGVSFQWFEQDSIIFFISATALARTAFLRFRRQASHIFAMNWLLQYHGPIKCIDDNVIKIQINEKLK